MFPEAHKLEELKTLLESLQPPELDYFDAELYNDLSRMMHLMRRHEQRFELAYMKLLGKCQHRSSTMRVENRYETTRCNYCGIVLHSHPLPGVPWDTD